MKPSIALSAVIMLAANVTASPLASATGRSVKNLDISNNEDPAEFAQDILEMGIEDQRSGYSPAEGQSRLSVLIDKSTQSITILEDGRVILQDRVSTGGTMKSPNNPRNPKPPRCANTPEFKKYIPANNQTMFPVWHSNTYVSSETHEPIPMPFAIRIEGGFFLHEVPPSMTGYLGYAVSGGCIRLPAKTARFLYAKMKEHGGINLDISGPNPSPVNNPPPYNHICKKDEFGAAFKVPVKGGAPVRGTVSGNTAQERRNMFATPYDLRSSSQGLPKVPNNLRGSVFNTISNPRGLPPVKATNPFINSVYTGSPFKPTSRSGGLD